MLLQKYSVATTLIVLLGLSGCVSQSSYVGNDRQVGQRSVDNTEAARTRISLGLNYLRRGDTTQAKYNLERARTFAPNLPEVYSALAFYFQTVGEHAQAEAAYKQALAKDSNNADAYNNYGAFLCQIGKYEEAERLLLTAISRPGYIRVAESYENLALCQLEQRGFDKARIFLESSVAHNATRITSLMNLASVHYAMGNNVGAKTELQRIQRLGRVSSRSTLLNYLVAEKQGDVATQKHAEQLLLTLYIDSAEARLLLQKRLLDSEFEQLREQYKDTLMANIVMPADFNRSEPTPAVANPQMRVVRRKSPEQIASEQAATEGTPTEPVRRRAQRPVPAASETATAAVPVAEQVIAAHSHSTSAIASGLRSAATPVVEQPVISAPAAEPEAGRITAGQPRAVISEDATAQSTSVIQGAVATPAYVMQPIIRELTEAELLAAQVLVNEQEPAAEPEQPELTTLEQPELTTLEQPELITLEQPELNTTGMDQTVQAAQAPTALPEEIILASVHSSTVLSGNVDDADQSEDNRAETDLSEMLPAPAIEDLDAVYLDTVSSGTVESDTVPFHIVIAGESLYGISVKHNIRLARLMEWNQLTPEARIKTGDIIWLAAGGELVKADTRVQKVVSSDTPFHHVQDGETLFAISVKYNVRLARLQAWNNLGDGSRLRVGQKLWLVDPGTFNHE